MTSMVVMMVLMVVFVGAILAATPYIMPPTECFAVTVPPSAQHDPRVRGYKRAYVTGVLTVTAACTVGLGLVMAGMTGAAEPTPAQVGLLSGAISAATLVPLAAGMGLMLHFRARVRELKQVQGWSASEARATAVVGGNVPRPISLAWNLLYVVVVLAMVLFALSSYESFPAQIPMNVDFMGNVERYAPKSMGSVLFPAMVAGFMGVVFTITHAMTIASKKPVDPAAPATSAYAYGRFARLQSQMTLVMGLVLSTTIGMCFYMSTLGVLSLSAVATVVTVITLAIVAVVVVVSMLTGQAGGRLAAELRTNDTIGRDDDAYWPLGVFYCNAEDPSIVVPKRFGVGWTVNIARPGAWAVMGGMAAIIVVFCLLVNWAVG